MIESSNLIGDPVNPLEKLINVSMALYVDLKEFNPHLPVTRSRMFDLFGEVRTYVEALQEQEIMNNYSSTMEEQPELEEIINQDTFWGAHPIYTCPCCQGLLKVSPNPYRTEWDDKQKFMVYHHALDCRACEKMWKPKETKPT